MQTFANTGIKTEVIDEIISFAKKHDIHCVILFGSRARGDFKRRAILILRQVVVILIVLH